MPSVARLLLSPSSGADSARYNPAAYSGGLSTLWHCRLRRVPNDASEGTGAGDSVTGKPENLRQRWERTAYGPSSLGRGFSDPVPTQPGRRAPYFVSDFICFL